MDFATGGNQPGRGRRTGQVGKGARPRLQPRAGKPGLGAPGGSTERRRNQAKGPGPPLPVPPGRPHHGSGCPSRAFPEESTYTAPSAAPPPPSPASPGPGSSGTAVSIPSVVGPRPGRGPACSQRSCAVGEGVPPSPPLGTCCCGRGTALALGHPARPRGHCPAARAPRSPRALPLLLRLVLALAFPRGNGLSASAFFWVSSLCSFH